MILQIMHLLFTYLKQSFLHAYNQLVLIIEHNLDVIKTVDHIIDIGPEGGKGGGKILVKGSPEAIIKNKSSHTARFLKKELH